MKQHQAFTMIELVFVIVVLGILAAIAVPKLAATRTDAEITRGKTDVATIRSAIVAERQSRLMLGQSNYISALDTGVASNAEDVRIFDSNESGGAEILMYSVLTKNSDGHWMKTGTNTYAFQLEGTDVTFTYTPGNGKFDCNVTATGDEGKFCKLLTQ